MKFMIESKTNLHKPNSFVCIFPSELNSFKLGLRLLKTYLHIIFRYNIHVHIIYIIHVNHIFLLYICIYMNVIYTILVVQL